MITSWLLMPTRRAPDESAGFPEVPTVELASGFSWVIGIALASVVLVTIGIAYFEMRRRQNLRVAHRKGNVARRRGRWRALNQGRLRTAPSSAAMVRPDGGKALDALIGLRPELSWALRNDYIELAWPCQPSAGQDGGLIDCSCEPLPPRFVPAGRPRTLDNVIGSDFSRADRVHLLRQVARFLLELHSRGWAFGAVWWDSFLYCESDNLQLLVRNAEFARRLGDLPAFAGPPPAGWEDIDHLRDRGPFPSLQTDRYRFALMVHRLLVTDEPNGPIVQGLVTELDHAVPEPVRLLLWASVDPGRPRPLIRQWLAALDEPLVAAQSADH